MIGTFRNYFSVGFPEIPMPVADVWNLLISHLKKHGALPKKWTLSGTIGHALPHYRTTRDYVVELHEVEKIMREKNLDAFDVYAGVGERKVRYTLVHYMYRGGNVPVTELTCNLEPKCQSLADWTPVIEGTLEKWRGILGWQAFWPYVIWQGMTRVDRYELNFGELPSGYKKRHEPDSLGIRPGWDHVDTSLNPGRHKHLSCDCDVSFYPTAEMWLGPHFWQYAKCTKEEALAADFWLETRDTPHFTYFKCWPTAFTRPEGEQGRMQQRLWKLFFHEDCEWPPGSGTICDEPMYGPPELMPKSADGEVATAT
jgi:hypothetical protein